MSLGFTIVPAILEKKKKDIKSKLRLVQPICKEAQIDVVDGKFAPMITWPYTANFFDSLLKNYYLKSELILELHLMVEYNLDFLQSYDALSARKITLQAESKDFKEALEFARSENFEAVGASLKTETELEAIEDYLEYLDYIQIMCIDNIGRQGSKFSEKSIEKVRLIKEKYPEILISVDGGVCTDNIDKLYRAGARRFAIGSCIFKSSDPASKIKELEKILTSVEQ